ncbi:MAG: hypothetical protein HKN29_08235 [Rhodothermales bacterium]|nr:hypothetical protein [Rhodothermales bacterium]
MKRIPPGVAIAWFLFAVSWFLPVYEGGDTLLDGVLPGFQAFDVAVGDYEQPLAQRIVPMLSALTNLLMWVTGILFVALPKKQPPAWVPWAFAAATVLNAFWALAAGSVGELRIGYWLWLGSFAVMAVALFLKPERKG